MIIARLYIICRHQLSSIQFLLNNSVLQLSKSVKYLGIIVDEGLSWSEQIGHVRRRSLSALAAIRKVSLYLSSNVLITLYNAFVLPYLTYCGGVYFTERNGTETEHFRRK